MLVGEANIAAKRDCVGGDGGVDAPFCEPDRHRACGACAWTRFDGARHLQFIQQVLSSDSRTLVLPRWTSVRLLRALHWNLRRVCGGRALLSALAISPPRRAASASVAAVRTRVARSGFRISFLP